jgi:hypothetical protein
MYNEKAVYLETKSNPMFAALSADSTVTGTSLAEPADVLVDPFVTPPANVAVFPLGRLGVPGPLGLKIIPFGTTTAAQTFLMGVYGIERIPRDNQAFPFQWTFHLLAGFTCTLCTKTGIANGTVDASHLYCDTIALITNAGNPNVSCEIVQPGSNQAAHVIVDTKGAELGAITFFRNGSSSANNALVTRV